MLTAPLLVARVNRIRVPSEIEFLEEKNKGNHQYNNVMAIFYFIRISSPGSLGTKTDPIGNKAGPHKHSKVYEPMVSKGCGIVPYAVINDRIVIPKMSM